MLHVYVNIAPVNKDIKVIINKCVSNNNDYSENQNSQNERMSKTYFTLEDIISSDPHSAQTLTPSPSHTKQGHKRL